MNTKFWLVRIYIVVGVLAGNAPAYSQDQHISVYYYSALPEVIQNSGKPGLAEVATLVQQARSENPRTLFIHGGASLGPSILGALDKGAHMIDLLNMMEPDLMAVGKREFSYQEEQFYLHAHSAGFPFLSSNLLQNENNMPLEGVDRSITLDIDGTRIGFIALTSANVVSHYGAQTLKTLDAHTTIQNFSDRLRQDGVKFIILLADTDFEDLSEYVASGTVNAVLYAHNEDTPYSAQTAYTTLTKGASEGYLLRLSIPTDGSSNTAIEAIPLANIEKDKILEDLINSYGTRLRVLLQQAIGKTETSFRTTRQYVRTGENPFGNLVADAILHAMQADVAFLNSGGIRGNKEYEAGDMLTRENIQQELPFNNTVELFEVSGRNLLAAVEHGATCIETVDGCFLQVSNLRVTFDLSRPPGNRIQSASIKGSPIEPNQIYKLGTLNFLANGGDGFEMLKNSQRLTRAGSGKLLWEIVATYLSDLNSIAPKTEGRITIVRSGTRGN